MRQRSAYLICVKALLIGYVFFAEVPDVLSRHAKVAGALRRRVRGDPREEALHGRMVVSCSAERHS